MKSSSNLIYLNPSFKSYLPLSLNLIKFIKLNQYSVKSVKKGTKLVDNKNRLEGELNFKTKNSKTLFN